MLQSVRISEKMKCCKSRKHCVFCVISWCDKLHLCLIELHFSCAVFNHGHCHCLRIVFKKPGEKFQSLISKPEETVARKISIIWHEGEMEEPDPKRTHHLSGDAWECAHPSSQLSSNLLYKKETYVSHSGFIASAKSNKYEGHLKSFRVFKNKRHHFSA